MLFRLEIISQAELPRHNFDVLTSSFVPRSSHFLLMSTPTELLFTDVLLVFSRVRWCSLVFTGVSIRVPTLVVF